MHHTTVPPAAPELALRSSLAISSEMGYTYSNAFTALSEQGYFKGDPHQISRSRPCKPSWFYAVIRFAYRYLQRSSAGGAISLVHQLPLHSPGWQLPWGQMRQHLHQKACAEPSASQGRKGGPLRRPEGWPPQQGGQMKAEFSPFYPFSYYLPGGQPCWILSILPYCRLIFPPGPI